MTNAEPALHLRPILRLMAAGLILASSAVAIANGPPPHAAAQGASEGKGHGKGNKDHADKKAHKDKDHKAGQDHRDRNDQGRAQRDERPAHVQRSVVIEPQPGAVFTPVHRDAVGRYYHTEYARKCPPGLAKKNNGCMPPGQARKYAVGNRLPSDVVLYPVPQPVIVQLPAVPPGYRYARVGNDIVLLSPGTALIVDIISAF